MAASFVLSMAVCAGSIFSVVDSATSFRILGSSQMGFPEIQALKLSCRVSNGNGLTGFKWLRVNSGGSDEEIVTGSFSPQSATFTNSWSGKGVFIGDYKSKFDIELPASHVTRQFAGTYRCTVSSSSGTSSHEVVGAVYYKPTFSLPSSYTVIESTNLHIGCEADAYPEVNGFKWTGPYGYDSKQISSQGYSLRLDGIDRSRGGNYTCIVRQTVWFATYRRYITQSEHVNVVVQYKPTVTVPSTYTVIESTTLKITCTSDGNPPVSANKYRWTGPFGYSSTGPTLFTTNIDRKQGGVYTCTAINTLTPTGWSPQQGTGTGEVNVVVQYRPTVTLPNRTYTVTEFTTLQITCAADALPPVSNNNYRWTGPDGYCSTGSNLQITKSDRNRSGVYICTATNTMTPTEGSPQQGSGTGQVIVLVQNSIQKEETQNTGQKKKKQNKGQQERKQNTELSPGHGMWIGFGIGFLAAIVLCMALCILRNKPWKKNLNGQQKGDNYNEQAMTDKPSAATPGENSPDVEL